MSYTPPNLAVIPYRIFYLEKIKLAYIKIYTEIFHLWQSDKPCFIGNQEFMRRTGLAKRTVQEAINYFEEKGELKRVQKGNKRYLIQPERKIETDNPDEESPPQNDCSISDKGCEVAHGGVQDSAPKGCEVAHHTIKYKNENKKEREEQTLPLNFKSNDETRAQIEALPLTDDEKMLEYQKFLCHYKASKQKFEDWNPVLHKWMLMAYERKLQRSAKHGLR